MAGPRPLGKYMTILDEAEENVSHIRNKKSGDLLGTIEFYPPWNRHVFSAVEGCVFSSDCLRALATELDRIRSSGSSPAGRG